MRALNTIHCSIGGHIRKGETFVITGYDRVSHTVSARSNTRIQNYRFDGNQYEWGYDYIETS